MKKTIIFIITALSFLILFSVTSHADLAFRFVSDTKELLYGGKTTLVTSGGGTGTITWESSDSSIVTVNSEGLITGVKTGKATITATRGNEKATCVVNVVYQSLKIISNSGRSQETIDLMMGLHEKENLVAKVTGTEGKEDKNANVTWSSSDSSIVKIDEKTGTITAQKKGNVTITATATGVTASCKVKVSEAPTYTDFSKAKYDLTIDTINENLKISGVKANSNSSYYYIVASKEEEPTVKTATNGQLDIISMKNEIDSLHINADENYMFSRDFTKYAELNQDLYLYVFEDIKLNSQYYDEKGNYVSRNVKVVVDGKKLERAELPQLNLILKSMYIGKWKTSKTQDAFTFINFDFPSATKNRKFNLKIGAINDVNILQKIKNNDYNGIKELLTYAKNNSSVFSKKLTTTSEAYYRSDDVLFDGDIKLKDGKYYYIYVNFDDEDGKYYPIEGVTLGKAYLSSSSANTWNLWAYTSSEFKWDNLTVTSNDQNTVTTNTKTKDVTVAKTILPKTGKDLIIYTLITVVIISGIVGVVKYNKYKGIK